MPAADGGADEAPEHGAAVEARLRDLGKRRVARRVAADIVAVLDEDGRVEFLELSHDWPP